MIIDYVNNGMTKESIEEVNQKAIKTIAAELLRYDMEEITRIQEQVMKELDINVVIPQYPFDESVLTDDMTRGEEKEIRENHKNNLTLYRRYGFSKDKLFECAVYEATRQYLARELKSTTEPQLTTMTNYIYSELDPEWSNWGHDVEKYVKMLQDLGL